MASSVSRRTSSAKGSGVSAFKYQSLSCHDWSCNCSVPESVTRYNYGSANGAIPRGPTIYERGFMLTGVENGGKTSDAATIGENKKMVCFQQPKKQISLNLTPLRAKSRGIEDRLADLQKRKYYASVLEQKPVSSKGPFRISSQHWRSAGHMQQWPWKGKGDCRLWSSTDHYLKAPSYPLQ